jgi:hypothetical protein
MGVYARHILPKVLDLACGTKPIRMQRAKVVPQARGHVVEIGIGSGLNLPHYDASQVERVTGIDPDDGLWAKAAPRAAQCDFPVERLGLSGEALPLERDCAPDPGVARWQRRIDPVWKRIAGGCHSGRDIPALFGQADLRLARLEDMYVPGPKVLSYTYWGAAVPDGE